MKTALLVIDAQRVYTSPRSELYCKDADRTIRRVNRLIREFRRNRLPMVFIRHVHKSDGSDLGRMFDYAGEFEDFNFKEGSWEVEFDSKLMRPRKYREIVKNRYSAFVGTRLKEVLKKLRVDRVVVCGFMTNFCCDSTARDAHDLDYFVDFIADATGTPGLDSMKQTEIRRAVAEMLSGGYACVYTTESFLTKFRRH